MYDIAVIGGGPAGLSAAVQARARGKSVLVVSGDMRDNPLWKTQRIDNYLGLYEMDGGALLQTGTPEELFGSGILERTFHVPIRRVRTENGWRYYYD